MNLRPRRLAEQDLPEVVLEQERIGDAQCREEADDVAVEENRLPSASRRIAAVLQLELVDDDVFGVASFARLCGAEETEQRALRTQEARELIGERLSGGTIEIVEDIPAENAIDRVLLRGESGFEKTRNRRSLAGPQVPVDIGKNVFDTNLSAELFTEEADVGSNDRPEIEQDRRLPRRQARQELA